MEFIMGRGVEAPGRRLHDEFLNRDPFGRQGIGDQFIGVGATGLPFIFQILTGEPSRRHRVGPLDAFHLIQGRRFHWNFPAS